MPTETKRIPATTVQEYLEALPQKERLVLDKLRQTIRAVVPTAEETISYQVPTFKYKGGLVAFAAFTNHCSFLVMSSTVLKSFVEELKLYKTATGTIQFTVDNPLPTALVKRIVTARIKENEVLQLARKEKKATTKKSASPNTSGAEKVDDYMQQLDHPLKAEIEAIRTIIKAAHKNIGERIKWNAPSYYYQPITRNGSSNPGVEDLVTFNHRATEHVHLVFHHPLIVNIESGLLEGDYKDRRMAYFSNMEEVNLKKKELVSVILELVKLVDEKSELS